VESRIPTEVNRGHVRRRGLIRVWALPVRGRSVGVAAAVAALTCSVLTAGTGSSSAVVGTADPGTPRPTVTQRTGTANSGESVARVHREVADGTLLDHHGARAVCPRCNARIVTENSSGSTPLRSATPAGYGPAELQAAYQDLHRPPPPRCHRRPPHFRRQHHRDRHRLLSPRDHPRPSRITVTGLRGPMDGRV
jgi:hypothetical protein